MVVLLTVSVLVAFTECRWAQLERESGQQLVYKPGILQLALKGETDVIMEEYATAMDRHHIP